MTTQCLDYCAKITSIVMLKVTTMRKNNNSSNKEAEVKIGENDGFSRIRRGQQVIDNRDKGAKRH
jgi:hypothetical protein